MVSGMGMSYGLPRPERVFAPGLDNQWDSMRGRNVLGMPEAFRPRFGQQLRLRIESTGFSVRFRAGYDLPPFFRPSSVGVSNCQHFSL